MKNIYVILVFASLVLTGCENYLDRVDPNNALLTEDDVWRDKNKINTLALRLYDTQEWFFETRPESNSARQGNTTGKNYASINFLSGEIYNARLLDVETSMLSGDFVKAINTEFANPDFYFCWGDMWEAVYVSNSILDRIDSVSLDIMTDDERNQIKGEALLFRALAYHELSKRWGPLPYIKSKILPDTDLNLPRPSPRQMITDIVADCDAAIATLPEITYLNHPSKMGRMGKAAAMALKSRALTTAASPNYTENNISDPELWKMAAQAAWDVINLSNQNPDKVGLYKGNYNNIFSTLPGTIEGLWPRYDIPDTIDTYRLCWLHRAVGGDAGQSPTQELIDKFETADGFPINAPGSGFDEQNPYANRDPRFYKDILYHGSPWAKLTETDKMDFRTSPLGSDRTPPNASTYGNSTTGYLVKKLIPEKWNGVSYKRTEYINAPYIRMAEMYLNYAEAINEGYKDPSVKLPGANISGVDALNIIRDRVGQKNVRSEYTSDYLKFQDRVRNEFQVELCFEYHTWFDLLRWRTAKNVLNNYNFHGVLIIDDATKPTGVRYERFEIPKRRVFEDKNYRYPLRISDLQIYKTPKLTQNPGW